MGNRLQQLKNKSTMDGGQQLHQHSIREEEEEAEHDKKWTQWLSE